MRRREAHVPEEVRFQTKPEQAMAMLVHAWEQGVPMRWVRGDEVYGDAVRLRELIPTHARSYVLAVAANTRVWTERPEVEEPKAQTGGRPRRARRVVKDAPKARMVSEVVASLPKAAWKRLAVGEGEKGLITFHWARVRVVESRDQLPGPDVWLLARHSPRAPEKPAYYLAYAPAKTSLATLARVASTRYTVEQCIEEAKGETGLDEYEVRFWHSWYRHITLSMMAHAWLASIRGWSEKKSAETDELAELTVPEVRRLLAIALPLPVRSPELRLACSTFRRRKRLWARRSHDRRRALRTASRILGLLYRFENGLDLCIGLKAFLKAA